MSGKHFALAASAACLAGLAAGFAIVHSIRHEAVPSLSILHDQLSHDFGNLAIESAIEMKHVFNLVNDTGKPLHIKRVASSCGCTEAKASMMEVPSGTGFQVTATLKISTAGQKREQVQLICDGIDAIVLSLHADVLILDAFYCTAHSIELMPNQTHQVLAVQLRNDDQPPPMLRVQTPDSVRAIVGEWTATFSPTPRRGPRRWEAWITLQSSHELPSGMVTVVNGVGRTKRISLDGLPIG